MSQFAGLNLVVLLSQALWKLNCQQLGPPVGTDDADQHPLLHGGGFGMFSLLDHWDSLWGGALVSRDRHIQAWRSAESFMLYREWLTPFDLLNTSEHYVWF